MRICFITGEYPPSEGGVGAFTRELALALQDLGHAVHIVTTAQPGIEPVRHEAGLVVHRRIPGWGRQGVSALRRELSGIDADIIDLQYEIAAYDMKGWINLVPPTPRSKDAPPLVVTFHDLLPPYLFPKAGPLRRWSVWRLAGAADGIVTTNAEDERALDPHMRRHGIPMRRIPIGSNICTEVSADFDRGRYRSDHGWTDDDLVVGFFGFMNRSKGIDTLIRALAELRRRGRPAGLLLIGGRTGTSDATNASYADEVDDLIAELALEACVRRTGFASQQEVSAALRSVDICALPFRDGANLRRGTLHAALAHGCATITTLPAVHVSELQDGVNVVLVPPHDAEALADAIEATWTSPELRSELGMAAATLARRFAWPRIAAETATFFELLT